MGKTYYRVFTGEGTVFDGKQGIKLLAIADGTSNTILVVEANEAVEWTKPDELPYKDKEALPKLGGHTKGGFAVVMCDGSVKFLKDSTNIVTIWALGSRASGEIIDANSY